MTARKWLVALLLAVSLGAPIALQTYAVRAVGYLGGDFRAFYCAARIASRGEDPYLAAPLHRCETAIEPRTFFARHPGVTIPAPLPGYALALLAPLAQLPFTVAVWAWMLLSLGCVVACIVVLKRLSGFALPVIVSALALSVGMTSLPFGENIPIAICAICVCALFASRAQWRAAAIAASIAMIEPQLGLPAALALFIWAKRARATLVVCSLLFAFVSIWFLGLATNLEYFARVLPAQALSELSRDTQYGLSAVLLGLGAGDAVAIRVAQTDYAVMVLAGLLLGRLLARRYADDSLLVLVPVAFAVTGGAYVHITQIAAALPAAVMLLHHAKRYRAVLLCGLVLLAVPWLHAPFAVTAFAAPAGVLFWELGGKSTRITVIGALVTALMLLGLSWIVIASQSHASTHVIVRAIASELPQASWSRFTQQESSSGTLASWAVRIPTFAGLLCVVFAAIAQSGVFARGDRVLHRWKVAARAGAPVR